MLTSRAMNFYCKQLEEWKMTCLWSKGYILNMRFKYTEEDFNIASLVISVCCPWRIEKDEIVLERDDINNNGNNAIFDNKVQSLFKNGYEGWQLVESTVDEDWNLTMKFANGYIFKTFIKYNCRFSNWQVYDCSTKLIFNTFDGVKEENENRY